MDSSTESHMTISFLLKRNSLEVDIWPPNLGPAACIELLHFLHATKSFLVPPFIFQSVTRVRKFSKFS